MAHWIRATYVDMNEAGDAIDRVTALGYGEDDVSVVMSPETRERFERRNEEPDSSDSNQIGRAATGGGVIGAAVGALLATTTVTGAVAATALTGGLAAPFVAGPLAAALAGLAGGSAIGALVGAAGWEEERDTVEHDIESGGVIVAVNVRPGDDEAVKRALHIGSDRPQVAPSETVPTIRGNDPQAGVLADPLIPTTTERTLR